MDNSITLPHPTVHIKHKLSSIQKPSERTRNNLEDLSQIISIRNVLFHLGSCFRLLYNAIVRKNREDEQQGGSDDLNCLI